jgi:ribose transport system permease protein
MSDPTTTTAGAAPLSGPDGGRRVTFDQVRPFLGPGALVAMIAFFGALYPSTFLTKTNLVENILQQVAALAIVASVQTVVMVVGEFDLSVGGLAALATGFAATMLNTATINGEPKKAGSLLVAALLCFAVGLAGGAVSGMLVSYLGVLAFIATLSMNQVFQNLARFRVKGKPVYGLVQNNFVAAAQGKTGGIPNTIFLAGGCALAVWFLLDRTTLGRKMYAVGGNPDAARYSGINIKLVKWAAFIICGLGAALGGLMQAAYNATANTTAPEPWMLKSIAAVFLGMALLRNGRANLPGTILGVILFRTLENGLSKTGIDSYLQDVINWGAVIIAVLPPALARIRENR